MAKRQSTTQNVVRIDGEGKVHAPTPNTNFVPLCPLRGKDDQTWVGTHEDVDCKRCIAVQEKQDAARERLEYNTRVSQSQEPGSQHVHPMEDARPVEAPAYFQTPKSSAIPAVTPVKAENGETVTVPVDYDNPNAGRRELDASKGERLLSEDTYTVRVSPETMDMRRERARTEYVNAFAAEAPATAEAVQALIRKLQNLHSGMMGAPETEGFSVEFHEPKNGPALECEIPSLPSGVNANTWELAHQGNTEGARAYHMRQAKAQETAYLDAQEAMAESRKAVELDTPPF